MVSATGLIAKLNLAWHFFLHCLKSPFVHRRDGKKLFLASYFSDDLLPFSEEDKELFQKFSRCFNCGLCDAVCPALNLLPREKFPGPSFLVTTLTRPTPHFLVQDLDLSLCEACDQCEKVCPNEVPIRAALNFLKAKVA